MTRFVIFDLEIFKNDFMLGCIVLDNDNQTLFQSWDRQEIIDFYNEHENDLWIGFNCESYDNIVLEEIIKGNNPFIVSNKIVSGSFKGRTNLKFSTYDLISVARKHFSLKQTELIFGKNIKTTDVDFNLDRKLNDEEKELTNIYNQADLNQTLYLFNLFKEQFQLKLNLTKEFNLDLKKVLRSTNTQIAELVLGAKRDPSLEYKLVPPFFPEQMILKNEELRNFYLNEGFRKNQDLIINVCGAELHCGSGGLHSAITKYHTEKCYEADVSGFYNSIMILYNLLPRTIPEEGKKFYKYLFDQQLELKKQGEKVRRSLFKVILLSVFGGGLNEFGNFYDPQNSSLVTILGQMFIVDLLEKLEGLIKVVQVNTDGIMYEPLNWEDDEKIKNIVHDWEKRTGFNMEFDVVENLWQRDVNNYVALFNGELHYKGEAIKNYDISNKRMSIGDLFDSKEPSIISKGIIDCLIHNIMPEDTVEKYKSDLSQFQYCCKKGSYEYNKYELTNRKTLEVSYENLQGVDRAFAWNSKEYSGMVHKYKTDKKGRLSKCKVPNLPDSVFIYNDEIDEKTFDKLKDQIDWNYYVNRIYERIGEFIDTSDINKNINEQPEQLSLELLF